MGHSSAKAFSVLQDKEASEQIENTSFFKPVTANSQRINDVTDCDNRTETHSLAQLLARQDIWRGQQWQSHVAYSTGFSLLDEKLADNGWPQIGVCEILCDGVGQGELSIVLPLLKQLLSHDVSSTQTNDAMVMLVAPPHIPSPQALLQQGLDVDRLLWIDTAERKERLWAIEQALASGCVPLVLAWLDNLSTTEARRLQLAAEKGEALCMLYLPTINAQQSHPVNLRLVLQRAYFSALNTDESQGNHSQSASLVETSMLKLVPKHAEQKQSSLSRFSNSDLGMTEVNIIKRRGGWPSPTFSLPLLPPHLKESLLGVSACLINQPLQSDDLLDSTSLSYDLFTQEHCQVRVAAPKGLANYSTVINCPLLPQKTNDEALFVNSSHAINKDTAIKVATSKLRLVDGLILAIGTDGLSTDTVNIEFEREEHLQLEPTRRLSLEPSSSLKTPFDEARVHTIEQVTPATEICHSKVKRRAQPSLIASYVDPDKKAWAESYKTLAQGTPILPNKLH
ncbi:translesion DNA synthesis-associated protein ImuA [Shewanella sp. KX20019]|uniref:translesion DNA synthesis-associated protein ImuA n=1 Tax=Shewanella sp. KX20019 TaxID=2803864 RepID=UPI001926C0F8|nr:translesion DNA synthesis-associated protein ImuA [Shewanella sp. KX20019]QQX78431.1 translesion DNA synthesis-associated protein ImuA [Shewanella sp. KX20019]